MCTEGGDVRARAVVIATGVTYRRLGVGAVDEFVGNGVFYGAAMTASRGMEGADVIVVGGGNSAGQAAVHLARFARSVTIMVRRPDLTQTMSHYLIDEIEYNRRISVQGCARIVDGGGTDRLDWVDIEDVNTGEVPVARSGDCSSCSAPSRTASGCRRRSRSTTRASSRPVATCPRKRGPTTCRRRISPPRCPVSSPPATSARAR